MPHFQERLDGERALPELMYHYHQEYPGQNVPTVFVSGKQSECKTCMFVDRLDMGEVSMPHTDRPDGIRTYAPYKGITVRQFDIAKDNIERIMAFLGDKRDLDPAKDKIFIAETGDRIVGVFAMRLIPLVHTCEVSHSLVDRRAAEALSLYAEGFTKASGYKEAMFLVEHTNTDMRTFITGKGAVDEGESCVYTLEVR